MIGLDQLISRVGGRRNATIIVGTGGAGAVWLIGRRKNAKSRQASVTPADVTARGYSDTADDPTAVYTGYDQLQREIDSLREQPGAPNPNPVPTPVSPPAPKPFAPPAPVPVQVPAAIQALRDWGVPLPTRTPTVAERLGPNPSFTPPAGGYRRG